MMSLNPLDRQIILATQKGLPLLPQPYEWVAQQVGCTAEQVIRRMQAMQEAGIIRRVGAVPNHYALGYGFNGMSVWDVADQDVMAAGQAITALSFVSHCYQRPRFLPHWPYNIFAMVHARHEAAAHDLVGQIAAALGGMVRGHQVLFSTKILKKTGLRLT
jgi:siroheme decarboxylase